MFLIKENVAYAIKNNKAYKIKFNYDMTYALADEGIEIKDISKEQVYTLNEVIAKLNIKENLK